jgi:hypothetical protein
VTGRGARPLRRSRARLVVAAAAAFSITVVTLWWFNAQQKGPPLRSTDAIRVGVAPGGSIPEYVESTRTRLAAYSGEDTFALVTFNTYLEPTDLTGVLDGFGVAEVIVRVPLPGEQTEIARLSASRVPDDVLAGLDRLAARKAAEAIEYRKLATDGDLALRQNYADGARIAAAEADAMRRHTVCIYAAVVRAPAAALVAIAGRPAVRAVDPAPSLHDLSRAVFWPPLPEQSDFAKPPPGR